MLRRGRGEPAGVKPAESIGPGVLNIKVPFGDLGVGGGCFW